MSSANANSKFVSGAPKQPKLVHNSSAEMQRKGIEDVVSYLSNEFKSRALEPNDSSDCDAVKVTVKIKFKKKMFPCVVRLDKPVVDLKEDIKNITNSKAKPAGGCHQPTLAPAQSLWHC